MTPTPPPVAPPPVRPLDPVAGVLSYLVPGLGQLSQGRTGKGWLFFIALYTLFFYGMWMGQWSNVFLADVAEPRNYWGLPQPLPNLLHRPQFAGQACMGIVAWPAIWHYVRDPGNQPRGPIHESANQFIGKFQKAPIEKELNDYQNRSDKRWDLGWVYTVVAGVLNILVVYDAVAGPAYHDESPELQKEKAKGAGS